MAIGYSLAEDIIIVEFSLVALLVVATYVLKLIYNVRNKNRQHKIDSIENYLLVLMRENKKFSPESFPSGWRKLGILLTIINKFDRTVNNNPWQHIKSDLVRTIILPLARKAAKSRSWVSRFYAAEAFCLSAEKVDEDQIIALVNDKIPMTYLYAINAAIFYGSAATVNAVITRMSTERRLTQSTYLQAFDHASPPIKLIVEKRLQESNDPYVKSSCYKILQKFPPGKMTLDISSDLVADNTELKISAIRFFSHNNKEPSIPKLIELLSDPHWEVKAAVLNSLGHLQAYAAIPELTDHLSDSEWWVRVNAAQALKNIGDEGIKVLKSQSEAKNKAAYEVAQYMLTIS